MKKDTILKIAKHSLLVIGVLLFTNCNTSGQKIDESPTFEFFNSYLSTKDQYEMLENSFPSPEECKLIFIDKYAQIYFNWINDLKSDYFNSSKRKDFLTEFGMIRYVYGQEDKTGINNGKTVFNKVNSDYTSTNDFREEWKKYYQPNLKLYRITFLIESTDTEGFEYNGFVSINGKWKYFPKPKRKLFSDL
jgi:hypothetical protein